jgi:hypothetical protein
VEVSPTREREQEINEAIRTTVLRDVLGVMTVKEHHILTIGVLATCYEHVTPALQFGILENLKMAKLMGLNIDVEAFAARFDSRN